MRTCGFTARVGGHEQNASCEKGSEKSCNATPNDLGRKPVDHSAGPSAHLMHCRVAHRRCLEPGKNGKPYHQHVVDLFPVLVFSLSVCHRRPRVHGSFTEPILCHPKMAYSSRACSNITVSTCHIFPPKTAGDPRQRDTLANIWTVSTAWFQGGIGPNSEDSPCPSVTSYWCSAEGLYLTVSSTTEHLLENQSQSPGRQTTIFSAVLRGRSTEPMTPELWLQIW